jgi:hypothetical protein
MNSFDKILEDYGLKYEDLNIEERETYNQQSFSIRDLSKEDIKQHIVDMKNSISLQLTDIRGFHIFKDLILKARLKNYILLEAFLTSPEKAETALRNSLKNIKPQKGKL